MLVFLIMVALFAGVVLGVKRIRKNSNQEIGSMDEEENGSTLFQDEEHSTHAAKVEDLLRGPRVVLKEGHKKAPLSSPNEKGVHVHNPLAPKPQPLPGIKKPKAKKKPKKK